MKYKVLIVDDQALPRQWFEAMLAAAERYELAAALDSARFADA